MNKLKNNGGLAARAARPFVCRLSQPAFLHLTQNLVKLLKILTLLSFFLVYFKSNPYICTYYSIWRVFRLLVRKNIPYYKPKPKRMKKIFTLATAAVASLAVSAQVAPSSPSSFSVSFDMENMVITGTMTAPTKDQSYNDLESLDSLVVTRIIDWDFSTEVQVYKVENPVPGELVAFADTDIQLKNYYIYMATAYNDGLGSYASYAYKTAGITPDYPSVSATTNRGELPVTVTVVTPTTDYYGAELTIPLESLILGRYYYDENWNQVKTELTSWENPQLGEPYEYVDTEELEADKTYYYYAKVTSEYGDSYEQTSSVMLGVGAPDYLNNVAATCTNNLVTITWGSVGNYDGQYVDTDNLVYTITRYINQEDGVEITNEATGNSYIDNLEGLLEAPSQVYYRVSAANELGSTYPSSSNTIVAGPAIDLPLVETFDAAGQYGSITADYLWEREGLNGKTWSSWYYTSQVSDYSSQTYIYPMGDEGGLAYVQFSSYSEPSYADALTSSPINVAGMAAVSVEFYLYPWPFITTTTLAVQYENAEGEFETVWEECVALPVDEELGWSVRNANIDGLNQDQTRVRFLATCNSAYGAAVIDNITIKQNTSDALTGINAEENGVVRYYDLQGRAVANPASGQLVIRVANGKATKVLVK